MKKSIMMLIAGSIAAVVLSGCVGSNNPDAPPASECYNWPWWWLKCSGNDFARGWNGGGGYSSGNYNPGQPVDNRDALERQGFVRTGATEYVKPNAYGLGTGMNQFGAPVKTVPANGF